MPTPPSRPALPIRGPVDIQRLDLQAVYRTPLIEGLSQDTAQNKSASQATGTAQEKYLLTVARPTDTAEQRALLFLDSIPHSNRNDAESFLPEQVTVAGVPWHVGTFELSAPLLTGPGTCCSMSGISKQVKNAACGTQHSSATYRCSPPTTSLRSASWNSHRHPTRARLAVLLLGQIRCSPPITAQPVAPHITKGTGTGTGTGEYHQGLWHSAHMDVLLRAAEARADIPPAAVLFFGLLMSPTATTF